jgi:Ca2+-binding EF-hand superfamily protein
MKTIDKELTVEEIRYIFEKLDTDDSSSISLEELEIALRQNGIPLKSHYVILKKESFDEQFDPKVVERRVVEAFVKLSQKLKSRNLSLQEVFDAYDINKHGDMSID